MPKISYTLIAAKKFATYEEAGRCIQNQSDAIMYNYKLFYVSSGIVVQVLDGSKNIGYLSV